MANQTLFDLITRASLALGGEPVQSFSDDTKESSVFAAQWRAVLDGLLTSGNWSFASADAELSRLVDPPADPRFEYQYQLPADWLSSRFIMDESGCVITDSTWIVQGDRLLSSEPRVFLKYIRTFEQAEITALPVWFAELFVRGLALAAHESLNAVSNVRSTIAGEFEFHLRQAKINDGRGEPPVNMVQPGPLRRARGGGW